MIKKSLMVASLLLLVHALVSPAMRRETPAPQDQWQGNLIRAQRFIYRQGPPVQAVIVGSSLSCRLVESNLAGIHVLAFNGLSVFDGLNILTRMENPPKHVFVEMNTALRAADPGFASSLFSPILYRSRSALPSLREENQPVVMFAGVLENLTNFKGRNQSPRSQNTKPLNPDLFVKMLQFQIESFSHIPDGQMVAKQFREMKQRVNELERKGVKTTFFEMPINAQLCELPTPRIVREAFNHHFPASQYAYLETPDCNEYHTTDGVHLLPQEAVKYTAYLQSKIAARH